MKYIVLGDIHGRDIWKDILNQEGVFDKVIFVGDYFDSYEIPPMKQLENFYDIMSLKKEQPDKIECLIGNHDHQYMPFIEGEIYSGFQFGFSNQIKFALKDNLHLLKIAHQQDNILFTHAGVSVGFLKNNFGYGYSATIEEDLNELYKYKPYVFNIQPGASHNGSEIYQSPIWIRPKQLMKANLRSSLKKEMIQIVGHTTQNQIDILGKSTGGKYYFIDTLTDFGGEYLVIEDGKFSVKRCVRYKPKFPAYE